MAGGPFHIYSDLQRLHLEAGDFQDAGGSSTGGPSQVLGLRGWSSRRNEGFQHSQNSDTEYQKEGARGWRDKESEQ